MLNGSDTYPIYLEMIDRMISMYALMSSGFVGAAAFVGGLIWAWIIFLRAIVSGVADRVGQRMFLIQAGGVLAFFTVRSIPEVCGAMFGVDFMVMLPVLVYLTVLDQQRQNDLGQND